MNLQPYIIYTCVYTYIYIYIKKQTWPEVKATYSFVQVNYVFQNSYKIKIPHAFLNHLNHWQNKVQHPKFSNKLQESATDILHFLNMNQCSQMLHLNVSPASKVSN